MKATSHYIHCIHPLNRTYSTLEIAAETERCTAQVTRRMNFDKEPTEELGVDDVVEQPPVTAVEVEVPGQSTIIDLDELVEDGKNKFPLFCTRCPSKVLIAKVGSYVKVEQKLPKMNQKKNSVELECDLIEDSFQLKDIFQFENVGFCHPVNQLKYLTCAECDLGPIGWQEIPSSNIFVALSRVRFTLDE